MQQTDTTEIRQGFRFATTAGLALALMSIPISVAGRDDPHILTNPLCPDIPVSTCEGAAMAPVPAASVEEELDQVVALAAPRARPARPAFEQTGKASWYGPGFHGRKTASGVVFNQHALTAAHRTLPLGTQVKVTNLETGRTILVKINDRGPYIDGRIIDLSKRAASELGMEEAGIAPVKVETLGGERPTESAARKVKKDVEVADRPDER